MLNEIKEYEEYTCNIKTVLNGKEGRIRYKPFLTSKGSKNTGIKRALLIIARHYLPLCDDEKIAEELRIWLGKSEKVSKDESWLRKYIIHLGTIGKTDGSTARAENVRNALKETDDSNFVKDDEKENSENEIILGDIIDCAHRYGELTRYYLFCKSDCLDDVVVRCKKTEKKGVVYQDEIFKTVSAYLIRKRGFRCNQVLIVKADLCNWICSMKYDDFMFEKFKLFDKTTEKKVDIFSKCGDTYGVKKISIEPVFLERFSVVEEKDFESFRKEHPDLDFYSDFGSEYPLQKNVKYK